jgi:Lrp/AsnC family leucine-responsive transcriptional regulator
LAGQPLQLADGLDEIDWQILGDLQENARLGYSELGRRVGLSPPAVAERVRRLEEAGIIRGYRAEVDVARLGLPLLGFIRVATREDRCPQFAALAAELPEVLECHRVTGGDSYVVKFAATSMQHLEHLLNWLMAYGQTTTSLVLSSAVTGRVVRPQPSARSGPHPARAR